MPKLGFIGRLLGDSNEKELKRLSSIVDEINSYADEIAALSDEALAATSAEFKEGLAADETLEDLLPEAFNNPSCPDSQL